MSKRKDRKKSEYFEWIVVAVVLLGYFLIVLMSYYRNVKSDAQMRVDREIISHGERLSDTYMDKIDLVMQATTAAAEMYGEKEINTNDSSALNKLGSVVNDSPAFTAMFIGLDGKGLRISGEEVNLVGNKYYNACMSGEKVISDIEYDDFYKDYIVTTYAPIIRSNKMAGVISMSIRTSSLTEPDKEEELDGRTIYAIINSSGIMVATYGSAAPENGTNIYDYIGGSESSNAKKLAQNVENGKSDLLTVSINGEERLINYRKMDVDGWYTVEIYSQKYIDRKQQSYYSSARIVIIKLVVALIVFFLIVLLINLISQKIYSSKSKELQSKAETDLLTGMLNKIATEKHIQDYIDNEGKKVPGMLVLIDVDNFKKINDTMGHAFGDQVLSTLGHTLSNEFRISDIFGRIGGDEFIIYLKNIPNDEIRDKEAKKLINFFKNFQAGDYVKYSVGASIGVSMFPKDGSTFDELYKAADKAVYRSKQEGKNQLRFYSDEDKIVKA